MHELHLMTQVVKAVETELNGTRNSKLFAVRLKVNSRSHLLTHDHSVLQTAFELVARGTKAEGATLEIITVRGDAWCLHCNQNVMVTGSDDNCPACGGPTIADAAVPEVMIHELVVTE